MTFLTLLFLFLGFYSYIFYPLFLLCFFKKRNFSENLGAEPLSISIIIAARNEEKSIREKILETLEIKSISKCKVIEIVVASDASDDKTDLIVGEFPELILARTDTRGGKEEAQKFAISMSKGEVLLFTDAKVKMNLESVDVVLETFKDKSIGSISSIDQVIGEGGSGEGMYVNYEMSLRQIESSRASLVGLSGSCFAVRREIAEKLRTNIPSDFSLLLETIKADRNGVIQPQLIGSYTSVKSEEEEFQRKVRTILRGITAFFATPEVLNFATYGVFTWQIISHKLMRWLSPIFLIIALLLAISGNSFLCSIVAIGGISLLVLATIGYFQKDLRTNLIFKAPLFFIVVNLSIVTAWWKFITGKRQIAWDPSNKV